MLTGWFSGTANFGGGDLEAEGTSAGFLVKLGADGSHKWSRASGGTAPLMGWRVSTYGAESILWSGSLGFGTADMGGPSFTNADDMSFGYAVLAGFDASGAHHFSMGFDGVSPRGGMALMPDGQILFAGPLVGSVYFPVHGGTVTSVGYPNSWEPDILLATLAPP